MRQLPFTLKTSKARDFKIKKAREINLLPFFIPESFVYESLSAPFITLYLGLKLFLDSNRDVRLLSGFAICLEL
jgi:hypothetical protein